MSWRDIIKRSARSLRQAKVRTLLTAAALAVGGFTLSATLAAANGAKAYGNKLVDTNFDPSSLIVAKSKDLISANGVATKPQLYNSSFVSSGVKGGLVQELNQKDLNRLATFPGVLNVFEPYTSSLLYVSRQGSLKYTGSIEAYDPYITHQFVAGTIKGQVPVGDVVLPEDYLSLLKFKNPKTAIGQSVNVQIRQLLGQQKTETYKIIAILSSPTTLISGNINTTLLVNAAQAKSIYDFINQGTINYDRYLIATVRVKDGTNPNKLLITQRAIEKAGYGAESAKDAQATITQIVNVLQIIIIVFGLITLVASFFGVVNTQYISVLERTREIGLMKALGMRSSSVRWLFIVEASWIGGLGAVIGSLLAVVIGTLLNPWISRQINFSNSKLLIFEPSQIIALIIFLIIVATIAGLLPARKASRLNPIDALRTE
jgi:putative ABC transport system permease protein